MKRFLIPLVLAAVALAAWLVFPGPFARGMVVGAVAVLGLLVGGMALFVRRMKGKLDQNLEPPPLPNASWDYEMALTDLSGEPVDPSEFRGKVLVLNFWATWCAPCVAEMPSLERLHRATADLGVELACVSREEPEVVRGFMEKRGFDLPAYIAEGEVPECFESRAIPATFVLDKSGFIAMRHFGAASWDDDSVVAYVGGLAAM